ncbi:MAG TPA: bifunctional phosphoribosyl-AMP cyclohydrolase/phosphoribosyl-ATP diphosphatase HisIE [Candidatus Angelobacter sp.]|nr:bifunctional phosphoribosyl-AMP cyclohydrolase/phosphoribosyl-ATP diphosphatase HisIE [Candidatus Angelobacter sp.]
MNLQMIKYDDKGLIPAIVQDAVSKEVLTLAYMNETSLEKTLETGETWFYSRSRQELWHKGETSGNTQKVVDLIFDCDQDALVVKVIPNGPACHKGSYSCFTERLENVEHVTAGDRFEILSELERVIAARQAEMPEGAYTTYLFDKGVDKILKKIGEEAGEVIIAAKNRNPEELTWEVADLFYHVLVLLREQNLPLDAIMKRLADRHEGVKNI